MSPSITADEANVQKPRYRPVVPASVDICKHCHIYLDEGIYISALTLLTDLVLPGASHPNHLTTPVFAPRSFHIELISHLLVHPHYTTQTPPGDRVDLPSRSITFLRSVLSILGPLNANLGDAFSLTPPATKRRRRRHSGGEGSSDSDDDEVEKVKGVIANEGRIRSCAKDFWHIVGWAFNCSVVHHKRWKYWKVWLDYMLDVLDADWNERKSQDEEDEIFQAKLKGDPDAQCDYRKLRNCLSLKYLSGVKGRSTAVKRVVGAIFTDGGTGDLRSYPEIFQDETLEVKAANRQKRKREDDGFGDLGDEDRDDQSFGYFQPSDVTPDSSQATDDGEVTPDPWMGGPESIILRQRLLALLSRVAAFFPECFTDLKELYEMYCVNLKMVPLPAFSLFVSPSHASPLPVVAFVSLTQLLQLRLLPNTVPRPQSVSNRIGDELTQDILEKCFLPFAASTSSTDDNAKVSILAENMLRVFLKSVRVYHTPTLDAAIEKGIYARETKIKGDKRRRDKGASKKEEEADRVWLTASSKRLRSLLTWVEQTASDGED